VEDVVRAMAASEAVKVFAREAQLRLEIANAASEVASERSDGQASCC
jgi:hypothetical protein